MHVPAYASDFIVPVLKKMLGQGAESPAMHLNPYVHIEYACMHACMCVCIPAFVENM
jgi:hypothetical protein